MITHAGKSSQVLKISKKKKKKIINDSNFQVSKTNFHQGLLLADSISPLIYSLKSKQKYTPQKPQTSLSFPSPPPSPPPKKRLQDIKYICPGFKSF